MLVAVVRAVGVLTAGGGFGAAGASALGAGTLGAGSTAGSETAGGGGAETTRDVSVAFVATAARDGVVVWTANIRTTTLVRTSSTVDATASGTSHLRRREIARSAVDVSDMFASRSPLFSSRKNGVGERRLGTGTRRLLGRSPAVTNVGRLALLGVRSGGGDVDVPIR